MKFIIIIGVIWAFYKWFFASKVVGKVVSIKPIRKSTDLNNFGKLEVKVEELNKGAGNTFEDIIIKMGVLRAKSSENWLYIPLNKIVEVKGNKYDFLLIATKKPDDNINKKKAVVCHIKAGSSTIGEDKTVFIDWGLVKII